MKKKILYRKKINWTYRTDINYDNLKTITLSALLFPITLIVCSIVWVLALLSLRWESTFELVKK